MKLTNNILYQEQWVSPRKAWNKIRRHYLKVNRELQKQSAMRSYYDNWVLSQMQQSNELDLMREQYAFQSGLFGVCVFPEMYFQSRSFKLY